MSEELLRQARETRRLVAPLRHHRSHASGPARMVRILRDRGWQEEQDERLGALRKELEDEREAVCGTGRDRG